MNKYFTDIMPQIRKTGKYEVSKKEMKKIKNLNEKIDNYKQELSHFEKKEYEKSKNGYFYISEDITIQKGKEIKCFKIGYCKDMQKRMSVYKVGHHKHKLISYITIVLDGKQLKNCVKTKMRLHLKKIGSDTICFTSLKKLKDAIDSCNIFIKDHICHCMMCKKKYKLKNIDMYIQYKDLRNQNVLRYKNNWNQNVVKQENKFTRLQTETAIDGSTIKLMFSQEKPSEDFTFEYFFNLNFEKL